MEYPAAFGADLPVTSALPDPALAPGAHPAPKRQAMLSPSYRLPLGLGAIALGSSWVALWLGGLLGLFALFLAFQAATLRIYFTAEALDLYRGEQRLRRFPYADWIHWEIFWQPLPILFYFKEVNNIHFLPILFDPLELRRCVQANCPRLAERQPPSGDVVPPPVKPGVAVTPTANSAQTD